MENKEEKWIDSYIYPEIYSVSDRGKIFNKNTRKYLNPCHNTYTGYYHIILSRDTIKKIISLHRLVYISFNDLKYESTRKYVIDHIDHDKSNNKLDNLQEISNRENCSKDKNQESIGTRYNKKKNRYSAMIRVNKVRIHLGSFGTREEAHNAYIMKLNSL